MRLQKFDQKYKSASNALIVISQGAAMARDSKHVDGNYFTKSAEISWEVTHQEPAYQPSN
jgi:hypothetical protein